MAKREKHAVTIYTRYERFWHWTQALLPGLLLLAACSPEPPATDKEMSVPALITAAEQGDISRVQNLLSANDPVDSRDSCQWTPLMKAALYGHIQVADQLIKPGPKWTWSITVATRH